MKKLIDLGLRVSVLSILAAPAVGICLEQREATKQRLAEMERQVGEPTEIYAQMLARARPQSG